MRPGASITDDLATHRASVDDLDVGIRDLGLNTAHEKVRMARGLHMSGTNERRSFSIARGKSRTAGGGGDWS